MTLQIRDFLADALGQGIGVGCERVTDGTGLTSQEINAIAHAAPIRIAEFAAGRRAARSALKVLGHGNATLPIGADRAPIWPHRTTGSISHDDGLAISAAMSLERGQALGIDLTAAAPLPEGTREIILPHEDECAMSEIEARIAFSAKETLFKALAPIVGDVFGFSAAVVGIGCPDGRFRVRLAQRLAQYEAGSMWSGSFAISGNRVVTALVIGD